MGNLIITGASVQHYGPLGIDDFPTGLKVTVNLKHAKSRDSLEIGKMYTMGSTGLYMSLTGIDDPTTQFIDGNPNSIMNSQQMMINLAQTYPNIP